MVEICTLGHYLCDAMNKKHEDNEYFNDVDPSRIFIGKDGRVLMEPAEGK